MVVQFDPGRRAERHGPTSTPAGSASPTSTGRRRSFPIRRKPFTGRFAYTDGGVPATRPTSRARRRPLRPAAQARRRTGSSPAPSRSRSSTATRAQFGIKLFDRLIDWGWFWFFTKPLFYVIDWFFRLFGNFGLAILAVTVVVKAALLPARQQILQVDERDEEGAAADGGAPRAVQGRQGQAAAGADGALQEGEDQPARRLLAGRGPDPGLLLALQGAVRHHRDAARAVLRLDPGPLGARSDARSSTCSACCPSIRGRSRSSAPSCDRHLAADHGRDDVRADAAQPDAAGPDAGDDLHLDAGDLHLHAGVVPGRPRHLLGVEQHAVGDPAVRHHAAPGRRGRPLGQHPRDARPQKGDAGACGNAGDAPCRSRPTTTAATAAPTNPNKKKKPKTGRRRRAKAPAPQGSR